MEGGDRNHIHANSRKGDREGHTEVTEVDIEWQFKGNIRLKESGRTPRAITR